MWKEERESAKFYVTNWIKSDHKGYFLLNYWRKTKKRFFSSEFFSVIFVCWSSWLAVCSTLTILWDYFKPSEIEAVITSASSFLHEKPPVIRGFKIIIFSPKITIHFIRQVSIFLSRHDIYDEQSTLMRMSDIRDLICVVRFFSKFFFWKE